MHEDRAVLLQLYRQRLHAPGQSLAAEELAASVWPDLVLQGGGVERAQSAILKLREMGLGAVILDSDDGWVIDLRCEVSGA